MERELCGRPLAPAVGTIEPELETNSVTEVPPGLSGLVQGFTTDWMTSVPIGIRDPLQMSRVLVPMGDISDLDFHERLLV